ncbi:MAG: proteasome assembly chaperone 4 family protein [Candidatus Hodarchaeota archaeon]
MQHDDIREFELETTKGKINVRIMNLENAIMVFLTSHDRFRMGPSALAIPPGHGRTTSTSMDFFSGDLAPVIVRSLAERVAVWLGMRCMVIVSIKELDHALMGEILKQLKGHLMI